MSGYSQIDGRLPTPVRAYTAQVRSNFQHARDEINDLRMRVTAIPPPPDLSLYLPMGELPLSIARGGTGGSTLAAALANLGGPFIPVGGVYVDGVSLTGAGTMANPFTVDEVSGGTF